MAYTLTTRVNHTVEVSGHLEAEVVARERQEILTAVRRRARLPGFRPGKAPLRLVEARFAGDIRDELEERLSGLLWREVLDGEDDFKPLTMPQVNSREFDEDGSFRLTAEVEVRPLYELPTAQDLTLPDVNLEVSDAEIASECEKIQSEHASWEPADEEAAADGILVEVDLHGEMEGSEEEPYVEQGARFVLGQEGVPEEVSEALQGARVGDERLAERRFPEDDSNPKRAGKTVRYRMTVRGLKRKQLPPLDDDLAKTIGLDSLDELRQRVAEAIGRQKRAQRRTTWRRSLLDQLSATLDLEDLPPSLVQSGVREELSRLAYSMALQGLNPDADNVDWQELAARFEPQARRKVLDTLLLEQLAEDWEIEVPESAIDAYVAGEAESLGIPAAEHRANLAKQDKLDGIRHAARLSATVDQLIRRAGGEV